MSIVFLGLGTNLGRKAENLRKAIFLLGASAGKVVGTSSLYETEPWGFLAEENFLNMAVQLETDLRPQELLNEVLAIEKGLGRQRSGSGYSSRVIDIDILLYEDLIINEKDLVIPHPKMHERKFVLVPVCEIGEAIIHPVFGRTLGSLLGTCPDTGYIKLYSKPLSAKL